MCFVIAVVLAIFAFNAFMADNILVGLGSIGASIFFIVLMIRNILHVKKLREEKDDN
jgi:hypothetical protein